MGTRCCNTCTDGCSTAPGLHGTMRVSVTADRQQSTISEAFTFDKPSVAAQGYDGYNPFLPTPPGAMPENAPGRYSNGTMLQRDSLIRGGRFGTAPLCGQGRVMGSACEASVWHSDTAIQCFWAHGVKGSGRLVFTVAERRHSSSEMGSYDVPLLRKLGIGSLVPNHSDPPSNRPGTGGLSITLQGHTLGVASHTSRLRLGSTAEEATFWKSDTTVVARAPTALARSLTARLTAGIQARGSASMAFSIDVPLASSLGTTNTAGLGQLVLNSTSGLYTERFVLYYGTGFATYASSLILRNGQTLAQASHWHSDTQLLTRKPHGIGGSVAIILTVGVSAQSQYAMMSYDLARTRIHRGGSAGFGPDGWEAAEDDFSYHYKYFGGHTQRVEGENAMLVMNGAATGALQVIIKTAQLAKHDYSPSMRPGSSAAEVTIWQSDTMCVFMSAAGDNWALPLSATLALQVSTFSTVFTYNDARSLSGNTRGNRAATGAVRISLQGSGFGSAARSTAVRLAQSGAESTLWTSDTTMTVRGTGAGSTRATKRVVLTSGELRRASLTDSVSFDRLSLLAYRPPSWTHLPENGSTRPVWQRNVPATGALHLRVQGSFLGLLDSTARLRWTSTGAEASLWESDTSIRCHVAAGRAATRRVSITAGATLYSHTALLSFDLNGRVSTVKHTNKGATGATSITVVGTSLSSSSYTGLLRVSSTGAEASSWASDSAVRGLISGGTPASRRVSVTARGSPSSLTAALSYACGSVSQARRSNLAGTGSASVTVHGASLGLVSYTALAREGHTGCEVSEWESETSVRCMAGHAARGSRQLVLTASRLAATASVAFR